MDARDGLGVGCLFVLVLVVLSVGASGAGASVSESAVRQPLDTTAATSTVQSVDLDGSGTEADPYEISDVDGLAEMANDTDAHYELTATINASGTESRNGGDGFDPVGGNQTPFTGSLDGNGHTITGLTINRSDEEEIGLFGYLGRGASVTGLRLNDSSITGGNETAILAGQSRGAVTNVSVGGDVDGNLTVGGLVGVLDQEGEIRDARTTGTVDGNETVGGLVGRMKNSASLARTYSISDPNATKSGVGALVATSSNSVTVDNSYYQKSIESTSAEGLLRTKDELTGENRNMDGFRFPDVWITQGSDAYPEIARWYTIPVSGSVVNTVSGTAPSDATITVEETGRSTTVDATGQFTLSLVDGFEYTINATAVDGDATLTDSTTESVDDNTSLAFELSPSLSGSGTEGDPYEIGSATELQVMAEELDAHYELTGDIDASNTSDWNDGAGFQPIGEFDNDSVPGFSGTLDGNGFTIRDLTIDRSEAEYVGLFGNIATGGTVRKLVLQDVSVTGGLVTGGLTGRVGSNATVIQVTVLGEVSGELNVGGVVGQSTGTITAAAGHASVEGRERAGVLGSNAGGLVGRNTGRVDRSFATGSVDAFGENGGGLVGLVDSSGVVVNSYATGDVSAKRYAGGLVGELASDSITASYATGAVTSEKAGALVGSGSPDAVTGSYWVNGTTGFGTAETNTTGLTTEDLSGNGTRDAMSGLDFGDTWIPADSRPPLLDWQVVSNTVTVTPETVERNATATATQTLTLVDGSTVNATEVGEFTVDDPEDPPVVAINGTNTIQPRNSGTATIQAQGGDSTATIEVLPAEFTVEIQQTPDVVAGETLGVTIRVENVGEGYGTETISLERGGEILAEAEQSIAAGDNATVTLKWQTEPGDAGAQRLTVRTPDEEATTTANVAEAKEDVAGSANNTTQGNNGTVSNSSTSNSSGGGGGGGLLSGILGFIIGAIVTLVQILLVLLVLLVVLAVTAVFALPRLVGVDSIDDVQINTDAIREDLAETFGPVAEKLPIDVDAVLADVAKTAKSIEQNNPIDLDAMRADISETIDNIRTAIQQRIG
jgi:hypothetical protein